MGHTRNKRVACADGFTMSVQAFHGAYCIPNVDHSPEYIEVEVGLLNRPEPLLMQWCEQPSNPCESVYGYVPVSRVYLVIAKHGGMTSGQLPKGVPCPKEWNNEAI